MRILIFGASGATGRELVAQALERNHEVTAFVRTPSRLGVTHPRLRVVVGNVRDRGAVEGAIAGQETVISVLGVGKPLTHDPVVIEGVGHIISAMERQGISRFIYLSFIGVRQSRGVSGFFIRHIVGRILRHEIADHQAKEAMIRGSRLNWTIIHAPKLTNGRHTRRFRCGEAISSRAKFPMLSRADLADCMLGEIGQSEHGRMALRVLP